MNERIKDIEKRADSYTQMEEIPPQLAGKLPNHYLQDIPALLLEIQRLTNRDNSQVRIINGQNETIDNLKEDITDLQNRLRTVSERYDLNKEIFSPPPEPVVSEPSKKNRVTDNRTP